LPWWQQRLYVDGLTEELVGVDEPDETPARVLDLDEDGTDVLEQFGMRRQVV
jgi:hypothetical protein